MLCLSWCVVTSRCFTLLSFLLILFVYCVSSENVEASGSNPSKTHQFRVKRQGPGFGPRSHHNHHGRRPHIPQDVICRPGHHRRGGFGGCQHHSGRRRRIWPPRIDENNRDFRYPTHHHHHMIHQHNGNEMEYYENRRVILLREEEIR